LTDFDAGAAAARAVGETPSTSDDAVAEDHQAAEGTDTDDPIGSTTNWREMLTSTEPDQPLEDVETPWDPERGGRHRVMRGLKKALGFSGMPAVVDVVVGVLEELSKVQAEEPDEQDDDQDGEAGGDLL
jgi:hypothetical protein